jgi:phage regulator Rha-like protein
MTGIIPLSSTPPTMSSREIAELTGKEHKNVLADIRNMLEKLKIDCADFSAQYKDSTGRSLPCFNLPKRETLILVSGYDIPLRARIIDRWQELEAQPAQTFDLATMTGQALRELAAKIEECAMLQAAVITLQPKADFYDHVAGSEALFDRADAAKLLRTGPKRLWASLRDWKIVQASGTPYQKYYDLGYFRLVPVLVHKGEYSIPYQQTMVTGKGLAWIKALMDSQVMPSQALVKGEAA